MSMEVRLTQEGYERLEATLAHERERLDEANRILRDLTGTSDDYDDSSLEEAKRVKMNLVMSVDELEDQLRHVVIIEDHKRSKVDLGAKVTLQGGKKAAFEVEIVSPVDAGILESDIPRISDESPLGKALLGRKKGETFKVEIGGKKTSYTVKKIS